MASSSMNQSSHSSKPANTLLGRIRKLENELSSFKVWKQQVEYTMEQTGIELLEPPISSGSGFSNSNSNTLESHRETQDLETENEVVTDEDLGRECSPCLSKSEVSLKALSERSAEIAFSEVTVMSSSPHHRAPLWQQSEDNSEVTGNTNKPCSTVAPKKPEVRIPASFKSSYPRHSSSRSRYRRAKCSNSKPKTKGIPKKVLPVDNGSLISANTNSSLQKIKYNSVRQEEFEASKSLSVTGTGYSKLYRCNICAHTEHKKPPAVTHVRFCHGKGRIHPCPICPYKFKGEGDVLRHKNLRHSEHFQLNSTAMPSYSDRNSETLQNGSIVSRHNLDKTEKTTKRVAQVGPREMMLSGEVWNNEVEKTYALMIGDDQQSNYFCLLCEFTSPEELILKKHAVRYHKCPYCPRTEVDTAMLENHINLWCTNVRRGRNQPGNCEKIPKLPAAKASARNYLERY